MNGQADTLLELVKAVASLSTRVETMGTCISELKQDVHELREIAAHARELTRTAKSLLLVLGLVLGFGGDKAVAAITTALGG